MLNLGFRPSVTLLDRLAVGNAPSACLEIRDRFAGLFPGEKLSGPSCFLSRF